MIPVQTEGELDMRPGDAIEAGEEMMLVAHGAQRIAVIGGWVNNAVAVECPLVNRDLRPALTASGGIGDPPALRRSL